MLKPFDDAGRTCRSTKVKEVLFVYSFVFVWIYQYFGDCNLFLNAFRLRSLIITLNDDTVMFSTPFDVIITNTLKLNVEQCLLN